MEPETFAALFSDWPSPLSRRSQLRKAKKDCGPYDKPDVVKTHLRDMLIMPEMIGSVVGVHNGKVFTSVEVKADMVISANSCLTLYSFALW